MRPDKHNSRYGFNDYVTALTVIRVKVFEQLVFEHKVFETDGIRKQMVFEQLKTCGIRNIQC